MVHIAHRSFETNQWLTGRIRSNYSDNRKFIVDGSGDAGFTGDGSWGGGDSPGGPSGGSGGDNASEMAAETASKGGSGGESGGPAESGGWSQAEWAAEIAAHDPSGSSDPGSGWDSSVAATSSFFGGSGDNNAQIAAEITAKALDMAGGDRSKVASAFAAKAAENAAFTSPLDPGRYTSLFDPATGGYTPNPSFGFGGTVGAQMRAEAVSKMALDAGVPIPSIDATTIFGYLSGTKSVQQLSAQKQEAQNIYDAYQGTVGFTPVVSLTRSITDPTIWAQSVAEVKAAQQRDVVAGFTSKTDPGRYAVFNDPLTTLFGNNILNPSFGIGGIKGEEIRAATVASQARAEGVPIPTVGWSAESFLSGLFGVQQASGEKKAAEAVAFSDFSSSIQSQNITETRAATERASQLFGAPVPSYFATGFGTPFSLGLTQQVLAATKAENAYAPMSSKEQIGAIMAPYMADKAATNAAAQERTFGIVSGIAAERSSYQQQTLAMPALANQMMLNSPAPIDPTTRAPLDPWFTVGVPAINPNSASSKYGSMYDPTVPGGYRPGNYAATPEGAEAISGFNVGAPPTQGTPQYYTAIMNSVPYGTQAWYDARMAGGALAAAMNTGKWNAPLPSAFDPFTLTPQTAAANRAAMSIPISDKYESLSYVDPNTGMLNYAPTNIATARTIAEVRAMPQIQTGGSAYPTDTTNAPAVDAFWKGLGSVQPEALVSNEGEAYNTVSALMAAGATNIDPYLRDKAIAQGYTGAIPTSVLPGLTPGTYKVDYTAGRNMSDIAYYGEAKYMTDIFGSPNADVRKVFVPYNDQTQIPLSGIAAIRYDEAGQVGFYQQLYDPSSGALRMRTNLVSSGGRNALQSGMFTLDEAQTPFVVNQWEIGTIQPTTDKTKSRLGAEAYGGKVMSLDDRTIQSTGAKLSTYANPLNLANLVDPFAVNKAKGELPNENLPWGGDVMVGSPFLGKYVGGVFFETDMRGNVISSASAPKPATTTTSPAVSPVSSSIPGVSFGPLPVGIGLPSSMKVADKSVIVPGSFSMESTTISSDPSIGNFALNYLGGLGNVIPGFFGQAPFKTDYGFGATTYTTKYQIDSGIRTRADMPKTGGADWTATFIGADNKPSSTFTEKVGDPFTKDGVKYQNYETTDISKVSGIFNVTKSDTVKERSVRDDWNAQLSSMIPAQGIEAKPSTTSEGGFAGIVYNYGQAFKFGAYDEFSKQPLTAVQNAAFAVLLSAATGGLGGLATKASAGTKFAPVVAGVGKYGSYTLGGIYIGSVAARSTNTFSDFSPAASQRLGGIMSTETIPFIAGGYAYANINRLPGADVITRPYDLLKIDYNAMLQEGQVTGKLDYISFKGRKAGMESNWYLQEKVFENPRVQMYADKPFEMANIDVRSWWQERGTVSPKPVKPTEPSIDLPSPSPTRPATSRMTEITVGGRKVRTLAREPSMSSAGGGTSTTRSAPETKIGTRIDYRNMPKTDMQPFNKQASGQLTIMSEPLPVMQDAAQAPAAQRMAPAQTPQLFGVTPVVAPAMSFGSQVQVQRTSQSQMMAEPQQKQWFDISPQVKSEMEFAPLMQAQERKQENAFVFSPLMHVQKAAQAQSFAEASRQMSGQRSAQEAVVTQASRTEQKNKVAQMNMFSGVIPAFGVRSATDQTSRQGSMLASSSMQSSINDIMQGQKPVQSSRSRLDQNTRQTPRTEPRTKPATKPLPPKPIIPILPGLPTLPQGGGFTGAHQTRTKSHIQLLGWVKTLKFKGTGVPTRSAPQRSQAPKGQRSSRKKKNIWDGF